MIAQEIVFTRDFLKASRIRDYVQLKKISCGNKIQARARVIYEFSGIAQVPLIFLSASFVCGCRGFKIDYGSDDVIIFKIYGKLFVVPACDGRITNGSMDLLRVAKFLFDRHLGFSSLGLGNVFHFLQFYSINNQGFGDPGCGYCQQAAKEEEGVSIVHDSLLTRA